MSTEFINAKYKGKHIEIQIICQDDSLTIAQEYALVKSAARDIKRMMRQDMTITEWPSGPKETHG